MLAVKLMLHSNAAAKYALLEWLARHGEQFKTVSINVGPDDPLETWLPDINNHMELDRTDAPAGVPGQARIVDVAAALDGLAVPTQRSMAFLVHVRDVTAPWNHRVWNFSASNGQLHVRSQCRRAPPRCRRRNRHRRTVGIGLLRLRSACVLCSVSLSLWRYR